jgi:serine/threonine-protein phosphatase PGAM5
VDLMNISRNLLPSIALAAAVLLSGTTACGQSQPQSHDAMGAPRDTAHAGTRYVYLIRHGYYHEEDPRDPRVGKGLDSLGRAQARLTGERLAGLPVKIDLLVSSTFTRAMETADIIGESLHMKAVRDSEISECSPPSYRPDYYSERDPAAKDTCQARLERAFSRYCRPAGGPGDEHDVLVCHGNVIRWLVTKELGLDTRRWPDYDIGNCSITAIAVRSDGSMRLDAFSDTGHLPAALQTWTGRGAGWSPPPPRPWRPRPSRNGSTPASDRGVMAPARGAAHDTLNTVKGTKDR